MNAPARLRHRCINIVIIPRGLADTMILEQNGFNTRMNMSLMYEIVVKIKESPLLCFRVQAVDGLVPIRVRLAEH